MGLFDETDVCDSDVIKLRDLIPSFYFDENDDTTDKFVEIFHGVFCQWMSDIRGLNNIYDLDETDERFVDMIIRNLGFDLNVSLTLQKKRKLAKIIVQAYKQKGTCLGIENTIRQFVGVDAICFPFTEGWVLDVSELSDTTYLNPAPDNARGFYTFDVIVSDILSSEQRRIILDLIELIKPAHSHFRTLIEQGDDVFIKSILVFINRGSLYMFREQNLDGGWDPNESDNDDSTISDIEDASYHGIGEFYSFVFNTELQRVNETFQDAATKLVNDAVYNLALVKPRDYDILLLNKAAGQAVIGADTKRDEASFALEEFMKAIAFLNDYNAVPAQILATNQPERDSTTLQKRSKFLYLWLINNYPLAEGISRYVRYTKDFAELGNSPLAEALTAELFFRVAGVNMELDFGADRLKGATSIGIGLNRYNIGFIYEEKIIEALDLVLLDFQAAEKLYFDLSTGTGTMLEQSFVLDLLMDRAKYDEAKILLDGIRLQQRIEGSIDDPINPGTKNLRNLGTVLDSVSRAINRIQTEGL